MNDDRVVKVVNQELKKDMEKPLILISNDDSISAKGLRCLVDCVTQLGEVWVVAPDSPHSGQSSAMTVNEPIKVIEHPEYNGAQMRSVTGTPVDCIKLAMHNIVPRRPSLVLAGINHGSNAGNSAIYSGTMGAVFEGCMNNVPSIGFSLLHHSLQADFTECLPFVKKISERVLCDGLPDGVCLNVNFPAQVKIEGLKVVRAARSRWTEEYQEYVDPHGKPFYWLTGKQINEEPDAVDTDLHWLPLNYATVVPTRADQNAVEAINSVGKMLDGYK